MRFDREKFVSDLIELTKREIKWLHQGHCLKTGVDCINLPRVVYEMQGLRLPDELEREFDAYHYRPDGVRLLRIMRQWFIEVAKAEPGDLLVFFLRHNPQHMAVYVGNDQVVEAYRSEDGRIARVLLQPIDPRRRVAAIFRIPDEYAPS